MSIHITRAPTVPLTSYDTKRSSHLNELVVTFSALKSIPKLNAIRYFYRELSSIRLTDRKADSFVKTIFSDSENLKT